MEKRNLSGKTILKLIGALLALAYLGFCLYAGITGNFPSMHRVEHVMRFGDLKNWVSGGMSAVMIFAFCITSALNDLNLQKGRKKSFLPLFLTMILPIILLLLLESYLDIGWIGIALYAGIAAYRLGTFDLYLRHLGYSTYVRQIRRQGNVAHTYGQHSLHYRSPDAVCHACLARRKAAATTQDLAGFIYHGHPWRLHQ